MYILRCIALSVFAFFMAGTSADAHNQPSLTKEQQQILATLKQEYKAYEQEHQKEFKKVIEGKQQFIEKNKAKFDKMIALEKQFKEENKELVDKLIQAQEKFQKEHPEIKWHTKELSSAKEMSKEEKYHLIYMRLLHESMNETHGEAHKMQHHKDSFTQKGKQIHKLHKQFIEENKDIINQLKESHKKFEQTHKEDWNKLQTSFHTYYNAHKTDLLKAQTLKKQFIEEHKEEISKLGPAAPMFFHEIGFGKWAKSDHFSKPKN